MNSTYRFEKSFGPTASFAGIIVLVAGLVTTYFFLNGIILLVVGAFMAFTDSSTTIDSANKRVRFTNNIFGIIRIGKWINVERDMKIGIKQDRQVYRTYGRSNQAFDLSINYRKMYLCDKNAQPILPLTIVEEQVSLKDEIEKYCIALDVKGLT
jgi:hypothetical protein